MPAPLRSPVFLAGLAASLILASAYGFQYLGGIPPCELCWWQRYVYMLAIPLGFLGYSFERLGARPMARWTLALLSCIFLAGAGIAIFHVGVEQHWWRGLDACSANDLKGDLTLMLKDLMATPVVRCDKIAWSLFGLSMAGYNVILSLALAAFCAVNAGKKRKV